jgi:hypothetical protein
MRKLIIAALLAVSGITAFGQMTPQEPITNFRLPMFGDNGYRTWEMMGDEGRYISPEKIDVIQMRLDVFSGNADSKVENRIRSPQATLWVNKNVAFGDSPIQILSATYRVDGERWYWDGKLRRVVISSNARVTFNEGLSL